MGACSGEALIRGKHSPRGSVARRPTNVINIENKSTGPLVTVPFSQFRDRSLSSLVEDFKSAGEITRFHIGP